MSGPLRSDPDRDLVLACQAAPADGFHGPFRDLYEAYKDRVYNVCYRITGSATDALDASQETFGILYRKLSAFRFESKFSSWVYRIAVNASIDIKRRSVARPTASLEAFVQDDGEAGRIELIDDATEAPMQAASRHELEVDIQRAIDRLSPKMRAITVLRYIEGLSYDEISESLEISLGTVKSRLSRAHTALDRELTPVLDRHFVEGHFADGRSVEGHSTDGSADDAGTRERDRRTTEHDSSSE
jgi:RNA polymerase sigma-70 factor (ECF subfamily)